MKASRDELATANVMKLIRQCERGVEMENFTDDEKMYFINMREQAIVNRSLMGDEATLAWFLTNLKTQRMLYEFRKNKDI